MKRALLVIDVQNEFFSGEYQVTYPKNSLQNIVSVMEKAKECSLPIILIQHTNKKGSHHFQQGTSAWDLHPQINGRSYDHYIEKKYPGAFTNTDLDEVLRSEGVDTVVITGYETNLCCDTTARQAKHLGYHIEFLADATGTLDHENQMGFISAQNLHQATLINHQAHFSKVMTVAQWCAEIQKK
ncbi:cysteine hydrolase family protein [Mechercharimyces sp. CAU 1602]|uniref:cysteine hydrolase family protein n=1 Tax=Mechercharimyces sp. CAU 1602 TaxID=2973933 RepID=UPI002162512D|nr:cysteine hydrolase family protein [Mechercharimyces sp. CAU 1602]MCS1352733.1 cysteine hydrolase [Mechercharimyces sp. CAU 1602]